MQVRSQIASVSLHTDKAETQGDPLPLPHSSGSSPDVDAGCISRQFYAFLTQATQATAYNIVVRACCLRLCVKIEARLMRWHYNPFVFPLLAAVLAIAIAFSAWRRRSMAGATLLAVLMVAVAEWSLEYALELRSATLENKLLWAKLEYLGIVTAPVAWLSFALQYTGQEKWLTRRNLARLLLIPVFTLLLVWTNDSHGLIWSSAQLHQSGSFLLLYVTHGAGFWVFTVYAYLLMLLGTWVLLRAFRSRTLYRKQALTLLVAAFVPWLGNALYLFGLSSRFPLDLTPFAFTLAGLILSWGLFHFHLLDVVPVARSSLIERMDDMVIVLDARGRVVDLNPAAQRALGCKLPQVIGQPAEQAFSPQGELPKSYRDLTEGHEEIHLRTGDSQRCFDLRALPLHDARGRLTGRLLLLRDITERKQIEEALHQAHEELELRVQQRTAELTAAQAEMALLISSISSILIAVAEDDRVTRWNAVAERSFGIPAQEVLGKTIKKCGVSWDAAVICQAIATCRQRRQPVRLNDLRFTRVDGRPGFVGVTLNPMVGEHGAAGVLLLAADVTERRLLESQLAQAQRLEPIGRLAAGIAHEINTPTQYVGDNVRFLEGAFFDLSGLYRLFRRLLTSAGEGAVPPELTAEIEKALEEADVDYLLEEIPLAIKQSQEGIGRVAEIVRAMREFSHPGVEEKTAVDINRAIQSTITVARNEWKYVAEVQTDLVPDLPLVPCLPGDFNQAFLNILINAAHAVGDVVAKDSGQKGTIAVSTCQDGDWVEIRVRDTGPGIPEAIRSRIFDPFFTTKEVGKGTGQGLTIARDVVVNKHGGTIHFETEVGVGTTFIIRLPLTP